MLMQFVMICSLIATIACMAIAGEGAVGQRPYEMVWANRTQDTHPPLVDFENLDGWMVEVENAVASIMRSREQQLWGRYVAKVIYRGTGAKPLVRIRPPTPIAIPQPFDCINFWVYGNNWAWAPDPTTPQVGIYIILRSADGRRVRIFMGRVNWKEWWVMHRKLNPQQLEILKGGARFEAIEITNGTNADDRILYFDNLSVYKEQLPPLKFQPRPKRGIDPFPGQSPGLNTGPGRLPFPIREETILPDNLTDDFRTTIKRVGKAFIFRYTGSDGTLEYRYEPALGTLSDVTAHWHGRGVPFKPMVDGGVYFASERGNTAVLPDRFQLLDCKRIDDAVLARWRIGYRDRTAEVTYTFRLWQKSLVIDVKCMGGEIGQFKIGRAVGVTNPRLVTLPYLTFRANRPAVLVTGPPEKPLFITAYIDWYRSNASMLWAENRIARDGVTFNGGSTYIPKTDGKRNDCFERIFLTVSPRFEEVLPNIPNPKSPWMHVAGERIWRAHGASNRERDYALWKNIARYGMTKIVLTDHETGWRDAGESFTLRTRAAPKKGGDEGQRIYSERIRALGFRYGLYTNYTDFAPVNEHWDEDYVTRTPDGDWKRAWARCYNLKPSRAVELEAKLAPIIKRKFGQDASYCDVHTAVMPWRYCDYDARVPGAGTFTATFYAYGEIMLNEKKVYNGPVYSEGGMHWMYCGLTDGNYGQDQEARLAENPWLVDFDLRKMHPLCCNFGMGNLGMFYGRHWRSGKTPADVERMIDRFLAATIAFGHTGFLVMEGGIKNAVRSYFMLQQLQTNYAQAIATDIRYANERGELLDSTAAVATNAYRRSQIAVRYSNGLRVFVNGHTTAMWQVEGMTLPPNGWLAKTADGKLLEFSALVDGHRVDYVDSPAYIYADGRGQFTRFEKAACDGPMIAHKRSDGTIEIIPVEGCKEFGIWLNGRDATAIALDKAGNAIGEAQTRFSRGFVYVVPRKDAFSYLLKPISKPKVTLKCNRDKVVPGEVVEVYGRKRHVFRIPHDVEPGTRLWQQFEGAWIDFTIVPLAHAELSINGELLLSLTSNLAHRARGKASLGGCERTVELLPRKTVTVSFPLAHPTREEVRTLRMKLTANNLTYERTWWLKAERDFKIIALLSEQFDGGECVRGGKEGGFKPNSGALARIERRLSCGGEIKDGLFMHPPYKQGVGYTFATFEPIQLPRNLPVAFRCSIGKRDGSDPGDGILFRIAVIDENGVETVVAERQWIEHAWSALEADLSQWAGQRIRIKLIADVGPNDNSVGDWACWADMRIESKEPVLLLTVHNEQVRLRYEPAPYPIAELTIAQLRTAKRGWVHFQSIGLEGRAPYICEAILNGVRIGELPRSKGNELTGEWGEYASVELPPAAIAKLNAQNVLEIINPGNDCFKMRNFWIELELKDGRRCSSKITTPVYTQPPEWKYAEGIGVPFGRRIKVTIIFDMRVEK